MSKNKIKSRIVDRIDISSSLYMLRLEKNEINFEPGQHITLKISGEDKSRLYSIASAKDFEYINVLIREIKDGDLSKRFRTLEVGSLLELTEPVGYFTLPTPLNEKKVVCIATGSGIAPFLSFANSYPEYKIKIVHGIRNLDDSLKNQILENADYITCTSKSNDGDFEGRVTDYIKSQPLDSSALFYICGNGEMIHEVYNYLMKNNISRDSVFYEEYFNN